jgi:hypothetical protein
VFTLRPQSVADDTHGRRHRVSIELFAWRLTDLDALCDLPDYPGNDEAAPSRGPP